MAASRQTTEKSVVRVSRRRGFHGTRSRQRPHGSRNHSKSAGSILLFDRTEPMPPAAQRKPSTEGSDAQGRPRRPRTRVRLSQLPAAPVRHHRDRARGARCPRSDANRRRQVAVLPDPGHRPGRHGHRRLAADRADAGSGGRAQGSGRLGGVSQFEPVVSRTAGGGTAARRRCARPIVCRARTAVAGADDLAARADDDFAVRHRRSALRFAVGS